MNSVGAETFALFFFSSCSSRKGRLLHGVMKIDEIKKKKKLKTHTSSASGGVGGINDAYRDLASLVVLF